MLHPNVPSAFSTPTLGASLVLLSSNYADMARIRAVSHSTSITDSADSLVTEGLKVDVHARTLGTAVNEHFVGELALVPPTIGASQV